MPRRLPVRPAKLIGNLFVLAALSLIFVVYYVFVFVVMGPKLLDNALTLVCLTIFHVIFVFLIWSFFQVMITDPGQVPPFWGFYYGDSEQKRRRYCLMCNVFKPERCHHCSACNRCVLNMDHHCPWINNCVGFWNRKYFLLLLFYVNLNIYYILVFTAYDFIQAVKFDMDAYKNGRKTFDDSEMIRHIVIQIVFIIISMLAFLLSRFTKFHIDLAITNKTTIENLDKKQRGYKSVYDVGGWENFYQIFGTNKLLWAFPIFSQSGKPKGDGIYWPNNSNRESNYNSASQNSAQRGSANRTGVQSSANNRGSLASPNQDATMQIQHQQVPPGQTPNQFNMHGRADVTAYPNNSHFFNQQQNQRQQVYGNQDNRIEMHGKNDKKDNLNMAIYQNHQKAQNLANQLGSNRYQNQNQPPVSTQQQIQQLQQQNLAQQKMLQNQLGAARSSSSGQAKPKKRATKGRK